ncbi:cell division protein ZipA [Tahibacter aquaticus]|uniref:Cell division protein ZipA n=1 Tax=Tahibacter aquaticus TaxID=520092 RepID=A0A4R6YK23_9GAMM|nr:cell division protein ZipA [Tahibacter aquaticus]TDR37404.1 cell division protein ZipA [Tahibacter aquaticus]
MEPQGLSANELRLILIVLGAIVLALIYFLGSPKKPGQGRRVGGGKGGDRREPTLGGERDDELPSMRATDDGLDDGDFGHDDSGEGSRQRVHAADLFQAPLRSTVGQRPEQPVERIVTLFIAARAGSNIHGSDLIVAAEKCGLEFGDLGIFHRLVDGRRELGPIFSAANMVKPGHFDMSRIDELSTPGLSFFMALPGPLTALDAWDTMLPTAQRLAELLDAVVLDEERNALGRQRISHIRDDLRGWDRRQEGNRIRGDW